MHGLPDARRMYCCHPTQGRAILTTALKVLKVKVRPASWQWLNAAARETNLVWNHVNELCAKAARPYYGPGKWLSGYDVDKLLAGSSKELEYLPAGSITRIAVEHADRRRSTHRTRLSWRRSSGSKRSLGWIPFRKDQVRFKDGRVVFAGQRFRVFDSYGLDAYDLRAGSFSQNALGEWFFNVCVEVTAIKSEMPSRAIGIDLGIKDVAVTSDGEALPAGRWYRGIEQKVAQAQRRGHKRQAKRFQRDAANRRKDALHKFSTAMVEQYGAIYIGDVSSTKFAKTRMAKSVLDSGWWMLKTMLQYKGHQAGRIVEVVNERFTTQACSHCGAQLKPCDVCGADAWRHIDDHDNGDWEEASYECQHCKRMIYVELPD